MDTDLSTLQLYTRFDEGSGPAIVMLHGINSDGGDWRTVIDTIGPGYRFIAFDLLGFGDSPKPLDIDYSADEHAFVIENTLQDLGVDDPFLLAGYSLGGDIALRYASTYPDRLRRLFLLDAPFYLPPELVESRGYSLKMLYESVSRWLWERLASSKQKDTVLYKVATGVGEAALKDAFHAEDIPTHWEIMSKNLTNTVNAATWVDDLPKLTMPVVHAIGVRDAIVKIGQAPALKRLKPDMEIRPIYGLAADHMTLWNMPEKIAEEIMRDEVRELNVAWRGGSGDTARAAARARGLLRALAARSRSARPHQRRRRHRPARLRRLPRTAEPSLHAGRPRGRRARYRQRTVGPRQARALRRRRLRRHGRAGVRSNRSGSQRRSRSRSRPRCSSPELPSRGSQETRLPLASSRFGSWHERLAADERAKTSGAEKAAMQLVPIVRSIENGVLACRHRRAAVAGAGAGPLRRADRGHPDSRRIPLGRVRRA